MRRWRNRVIASPRFRRIAARTPLLRSVARRSTKQLFDLTAGFTYTQALYTFVETGVGNALAPEPKRLADLAHAKPEHSSETIERVLEGALGIGLVVRHGDLFALSDLGTALMNEPGLLAMVRHHAIVYRDLVEPVALLRGETKPETAEFWQYAGGRSAEGTDAAGAARYSELMAVTQGFVADEVISAYPFRQHHHVCDIGGGSGAFIERVAATAPNARLTVFDLPDVVPLAEKRFRAVGISERTRTVGGSFYTDPLPSDADLYTLVRVLYDHDDEPAARLLSNVRRTMPKDATLLLAEPMAGLATAESVGTYFTYYLAAMRSGRCRSPQRTMQLLNDAGFVGARTHRVRNPVFTGLVTATAH